MPIFQKKKKGCDGTNKFKRGKGKKKKKGKKMCCYVSSPNSPSPFYAPLLCTFHGPASLIEHPPTP